MIENTATPQARSRKSRRPYASYDALYRCWDNPLPHSISALPVTQPRVTQRVLLPMRTWLTHLSRLVISRFRMHVYLLSGPNWSAAYIGAGSSFEELCNVLFPSAPSSKLVRKIFLWQLPSMVHRLEAEVDLIALELNPMVRWHSGNTLPMRMPRRINFGSGHAQTSNEVFQFKQQSDTHVALQNGIESYWVLHSANLPATLRQHLNQCGLISEHKGTLYQVVLLAPDEQLSDVESQQFQTQALENGLAGVLTISTQRPRQIYQAQAGTVYGR